MRVAIYTRISTDETMQPYSLGAQQQRLESYVASQEDWQLVRHFEDKASGASLERPALQRMLSEAEGGRFDLLLVYKVDRLARSTRGLAQLLEQLDAAAVGFRSASEPFDTTSSAGRMMVQMLGVFAEFERATIVERVIAGMERKASRGEWTGGSTPYGYRIDEGRQYLELEPTQAPIVAEIFDRYARRLEGATAIARWLTERGYQTRNGKPFGTQSVLTIIRNRAYLGEINYRGIHYPAPHPKLIDKELFEQANRVLKQRGDDPSLRRSNQSDYLLTGLVRCSRCGKRYLGAAANSKSGRYRYYVCFSRQRYGRTHCDADNLPADQLEDAILNALDQLLTNTPLLEQAIAEAYAELDADRPRRQIELDQLHSEEKKLETALDRYFDAFETGNLSPEACKHRIDDLHRRRSGLQQRRAELEADDKQAPTPPTQAELAQLANDTADIMRAGKPRQQKALLQALIAQIDVSSREEIQPTFYTPTVRPPNGSVRPARFELATSASAGQRSIP